MDLTALASLRDDVWLYVVGPVLAIAAVIVAISLRLPQLRLLPAAFRSIRAHDARSGAALHPTAATLLAACASYGAAAAVGAATAISLGGPGAIAWVWLFCFLIAPLRYVEAVLARTNPPGAKDAAVAAGPPSSLPERLLRQGGPWRSAGWLLIGLGAIAAVLFVGGVHGGATVDAASGLVPDGATPLVLGVAVVAGGLGIAGARRTGAITGALAGVALAVLLLVALLSAGAFAGRSAGAIVRALQDAIEGAPSAGAFTGAFAGEIAVAAMLHVFPPLASSSTIDGALHGEARAATTRGQAASALLGPLIFAVVTTVVGLAIVGTNAFSTTRTDERTLEEVKIYRGDYAFESASQRVEPERQWDGYVRIRRGTLGPQNFTLATERGEIEEPRFEYYGRTADIAVHAKKGVAFRLLRLQNHALTEIPIVQARHVTVHGKMLSRGGRLISAAMHRGPAGANAARLALAALLVLAAAAAAAWAFALTRMLTGLVPPPVAMAAAALPAIGLALSALELPWLPAAGALAGGALALATTIVLLLKSGEAKRLVE